MYYHVSQRTVITHDDSALNSISHIATVYVHVVNNTEYLVIFEFRQHIHTDACYVFNPDYYINSKSGINKTSCTVIEQSMKQSCRFQQQRCSKYNLQFISK